MQCRGQYNKRFFLLNNCLNIVVESREVVYNPINIMLVKETREEVNCKPSIVHVIWLKFSNIKIDIHVQCHKRI